MATLTPRQLARRRELYLPGGKPRFVRIYDNGGETLDNFTVVFSGRYREYTDEHGRRRLGEFIFLTMNARPTHPQGICQHGTSWTQIDAPQGWTTPVGRKNKTCGRRIDWDEFPEMCQAVVMLEYCELWGLGLPDPPENVDPDEWKATYLAEMRSHAR